MRIWISFAQHAADGTVISVGVGVTPRAAAKDLRVKLKEVFEDWLGEDETEDCFETWLGNFIISETTAEEVRKADPIEMVMGVH